MSRYGLVPLVIQFRAAMNSYYLWLPLVLLVANAIVGAAVLTSVDRDKRLFKWYSEAPNDWLRMGVLQAWPYIVFKYYRS
jgi:hypothetical protein